METKARRAPRVGAAIAWSIFLLVGYTINVLFVIPSLDELHDFGSFVAAGQLARSGRNPYSDDSPLIYGVVFPGIDHSGRAPNLNPPLSVLAFQAIAQIPPAVSLAAWRITSVVLYLGAVILLLNQNRGVVHPVGPVRLFWALALAGFWHTLQLGQLYALALLFTAGAWILFSRSHEVLGGIALGLLISLKPNFAFWALVLLALGNRRAFLSAAVSALALAALPLIWFGPEVYLQWLEASRLYTPDLLIFPGNNSLQGLSARFGFPVAGVVLSVAVALVTLYVVRRKRPSVKAASALGILISLLISPIAWTGYTILTLPVFLSRDRWHWTHWLAALLFAVPFFVPLTLFQATFFNFILFGWLYGWGLLLLLLNTFTALRGDGP